MRKRKGFICVLLFAMIFIAGSCGDRELTLEKIAYNRSVKDYTVYLKENGEYVPYLALSSDYNGNVLLLRKNLLPDLMPYKNIASGGHGMKMVLTTKKAVLMIF